MRTCRAEFTIVDDEDPKMNRTEVIQMVYEVKEGSNMVQSLLDYLTEEELLQDSPIITGKG
ncbi:MAG: hypothetical protein NZ824_11220 [Candidatus Thioglobus sp.]|nr:hypothetical protein [Candidatus Thioglobus sp.]